MTPPQQHIHGSGRLHRMPGILTDFLEYTTRPETPA